MNFLDVAKRIGEYSKSKKDVAFVCDLRYDPLIQVRYRWHAIIHDNLWESSMSDEDKERHSYYIDDALTFSFHFELVKGFPMGDPYQYNFAYTNERGRFWFDDKKIVRGRYVIVQLQGRHREEFRLQVPYYGWTSLDEDAIIEAKDLTETEINQMIDDEEKFQKISSIGRTNEGYRPGNW
jgi:hypothetical protein